VPRAGSSFTRDAILRPADRGLYAQTAHADAWLLVALNAECARFRSGTLDVAREVRGSHSVANILCVELRIHSARSVLPAGPVVLFPRVLTLDPMAQAQGFDRGA
jgi:hypothetical protein